MEQDGDQSSGLEPLNINLDFSDPNADASSEQNHDIPLVEPLLSPDLNVSLDGPGNESGDAHAVDPFAEPQLANPLAPDTKSSVMPFSTDQFQNEHHDELNQPSHDSHQITTFDSPQDFDQPLSMTEVPHEAPLPNEPHTPQLPPELPPLVTLSNTPASDSPTQKTLLSVKQFSEKLPYEKVQIPASLPFSLLIEGKLTPTEKEKLVEILNREDMGVREVDLEPQFENDRVLIPRVSEFAGVLLVQALKTSKTRMRLGPADEIFSTEGSEETLSRPQPMLTSGTHTSHALHPAESIVVTSEPFLPQLKDFEVIDTIVASATLESSMIEAQKSEKYTEMLENLKKELQYKAHRKGATAIVKLNISLQSLSLPTLYRLTITGLAIKPS